MATVRLTVAPGGAVRVPPGALPLGVDVPWNSAGAVYLHVYANGCACAHNMAVRGLLRRSHAGLGPTQDLYIQ